jgi:hypothetical protein
MLPRLRLAVLPSALVLAACSAHEAPPPHAPPPPPAPAAAPAAPAVKPGRLVRAEVDRVLTTQGPPWVLRRVISEEVIRADGKFAGWRLVGLPEEWGHLDLRPGDVVTRVNGLPLETPDEAWEAWKSVASQPEIKITLMRDGATRQLVIPIDGAPSPETAKAFGHDPAPQHKPGQQPARTSIRLGGGSDPAPDEEAY